MVAQAADVGVCAWDESRYSSFHQLPAYTSRMVGSLQEAKAAGGPILGGFLEASHDVSEGILGCSTYVHTHIHAAICFCSLWIRLLFLLLFLGPF